MPIGAYGGVAGPGMLWTSRDPLAMWSAQLAARGLPIRASR
jgi:hypothetical protein